MNERTADIMYSDGGAVGMTVPPEELAPPSDSGTAETAAPAPSEQRAADAVYGDAQEPSPGDDQHSPEPAGPRIEGDSVYISDDVALHAPEGMVWDKDVLAAFAPLVASHNLSEAAAQDLVDLHAKQVQTELKHAYNDVLDALDAQARQTREQWRREAMADPTIAGLGVQTVRAHCGATFDRFFTPQLRAQMADAGWFQNRDFIKGLLAIRKVTGG